jgi:hypothetical protein
VNAVFRVDVSSFSMFIKKQAKMRVLEDLYFTRDEKRKSVEDKRTSEEKFELANEATRKIL